MSRKDELRLIKQAMEASKKIRKESKKLSNEFDKLLTQSEAWTDSLK